MYLIVIFKKDNEENIVATKDELFEFIQNLKNLNDEKFMVYELGRCILDFS